MTELPQCTFFVSRLSLRRITKRTGYQPTVRNMLLFPALGLRHIFSSYRALLSCARTPVAATVQGCTKQQEHSWWSWRAGRIEDNFTLQLLTLVLATHRQAIPRLFLLLVALYVKLNQQICTPVLHTYEIYRKKIISVCTSYMNEAPHDLKAMHWAGRPRSLSGWAFRSGDRQPFSVLISRYPER